ncbi:B cell scaffold protein with ankyrin repeats 1 [Phyllostomus discolor]|uniref:B cell scaffold protein with ankyrin repeats 1 n=1 Tax=Phyllostomus discolor TaxID=89673 RepID=A0A834BGM8_9CHIR|nr:B cell scaffold protein with ankyrin repeats 1 [Phyllostomus discolor]
MLPAAPGRAGGGRQRPPSDPAPPGSEDYLEFNVATDVKVEHSGGASEKNQVEELPEVSRSSTPLAVVLPTEIPCENPGEIFIILRDEVISDAVEVEFISYNKCIRIQPALWNKTVWRMKALDFPAGSVSVNVYCDGIMKATAEIKYYTTEKAGGCLSGVAGSGDGVCRNDMEELDDILTSVFKQEIPYYEFRSLQTEIYPQKEQRNFKELPTLLHCAAKFGLKNLAIHLLQCSGATSASQMKNSEGSDPAHIAERHGHKELKKIFEDFSVQEISRNNEQEHDYEEDITSLPAYFPNINSQEPLGDNRPPLPPPRPVVTAPQLDKPHLTLPGKMLEGQMERSQNWCNPSARQEIGGEPEGEEEQTEDEKKQQEEEEDPYTFAEIEDSEYDMILANMSTKKKTGGRSFIINRPPAPAPRPTNIPSKEETTPYIAQVFQQKAARRQSDGDKFHGPRKQDRPRVESQAYSTVRGYLAAGQEELILLQEQVKSGKLSVDQALEKFKHWQMGKTGLEVIQQEKLRQLRDTIIGKRPEEENVYDRLTIVHHPNGNESVHNENITYSIPFSNKHPARLQVEKEFGFCYRKDH